MDNKKPWYLSKGVWAAVVTGLLGLYGGIDAAVNDALPNVPEWVYIVLGALGLYARATATKLLGK